MSVTSSGGVRKRVDKVIMVDGQDNYSGSLHFSKTRLGAIRFVELFVSSIRRVFCSKQDAATDTLKRVLIMEPYGLGDSVLLLPMVDNLKKKYPSAEIYLLVSEKWKDLFKYYPEAVVLPFGFPWVVEKLPLYRYPVFKILAFIYRLRRLKIQVGIDVRGDIRSQIVLVLAGCQRRIGFTTYFASNIHLRGLLLTDKVEYSLKHKILQNLDLLKPLRVTSPVIEFDLVKRTKFPQEPDFDIAFHFEALWKYKKWPIDRWIQLAGMIYRWKPLRIQVIAQESKIDDALYFCDHIHFPVTLSITRSIDDLIRYLSNSRSYIGLDSGPMHVAVALGRKVVALFGPGNSELFFPWGQEHSMIHKHHSYPCAPCKQQECIHSHETCMEAIEVEEVYNKFIQVIGNSHEQSASPGVTAFEDAAPAVQAATNRR